MTSSTPLDMSPELFEAAMEAAAAILDPAQLRSLVAATATASSTTRRRRQPIPFRDAGQVLDADAAKVISRDECRRLLGQPVRKSPTARRARS